ncbi:MAG: SSU ribosomal protein S14p (S29e) @ SSU ribosomal protein S14p (S29e), zinc-dependent, partial [uncultured Rubrobacteraceae bacterium]
DEKGFAGKAAEKAEVRGQGVQPLPEVRPGARLLQEVRAVPDLPQGAGARRKDPWRNESELV